MYDDDRDALAAEYVLGTLSADEREQAEALLAIDPGFAEIVRVWERRLGELNVMVEAVEPPPEVWDRIKSGTGPPATTAPFDNLAGRRRAGGAESSKAAQLPCLHLRPPPSKPLEGKTSRAGRKPVLRPSRSLAAPLPEALELRTSRPEFCRPSSNRFAA